MNWGILSTGVIAKNFAETASYMKDVHIHAVYSHMFAVALFQPVCSQYVFHSAYPFITVPLGRVKVPSLSTKVNALSLAR